MKIVILAGGLSPERDVSLVSASRIAKALISSGHEICMIDLYEGIADMKKDFAFVSAVNEIIDVTVPQTAPDPDRKNSVRPDIGPNVIECCRCADLVFLALHGDIGENGKIQAVLDVNKIKYTGSGYDGCFLAMDKNLSKLLISHHNIKTASWSVNSMDASLSYPCVVKPVSGGSSIGISIVNNDAECALALQLAKQYDDTVLIEEKIEGREVSVGILNDKPLPVIEIAPLNGFYDYKNKYQAGLTVETCPADFSADITDQLQSIALKVHQTLNLKFYSRIDFIVDRSNDIYFLEANTLPGMTPTSLLPQEAKAAGISYHDLCDQIALNALQKY